MTTVAALFGWASETWVAVGTLALASTTAALAGFTWWLGRSSRTEIATTVRPLLVDAPPGIFMREQDARTWGLARAEPGARSWVDQAASATYQRGTSAYIEFSIRNAGNGPALLKPELATSSPMRDSRPSGLSITGRFSHTVVPVGEPARLTLEVTTDEPIPSLNDAYVVFQAIQTFNVEIRYTDINGQQLTRSLYTLHARSRTESTKVDWVVTSVEIYRGHSSTAFALLAPLN